jgi:hypothetical protein
VTRTVNTRGRTAVKKSEIRNPSYGIYALPSGGPLVPSPVACTKPRGDLRPMLNNIVLLVAIIPWQATAALLSCRDKALCNDITNCTRHDAKLRAGYLCHGVLLSFAVVECGSTNHSVA